MTRRRTGPRRLKPVQGGRSKKTIRVVPLIEDKIKAIALRRGVTENFVFSLMLADKLNVDHERY